MDRRYTDWHMIRVRFIGAAVICTMLAIAWPAHAQSAAPLYRVFLADGTALASFGQWARLEDRVVFSLPLTPANLGSELHLVSIPIDRVDWVRTERYADAVRAAHYAATRGEADFAQLSADVAAVLNQVALITDPAQRLATAERARRVLASWPGAHYGYRAKEVQDILGVLDEVISGLRASAGLTRYDLALTAMTPVPPFEPLLSAPDEREVVEQLVAASRTVQTPTEKVSLLQTVLGLLDRAFNEFPSTWAASIRAAALGGIAAEERIDASYTKVRTTTLGTASRYAQRADVRALERLRARVHEQDLKLGHKRPEDVAALLAALAVHLDAAQRLRLAHDQWLIRIDRMRSYQRAVAGSIQTLDQIKTGLEDIRALAGPEPRQLRRFVDRLFTQSGRLALITPPDELSAVHAVLRSVYELADSAVRLRLDAAADANFDVARKASAAAAGALMLLGRARADLHDALKAPLGVSGTNAAGQP